MIKNKPQQNVPKLRFSGFSGGWEVKKLGDIAQLTSSKRVYLSDYVPCGIPFYRGKEISELKKNIVPDDILYISNSAYENFKNKFGAPKKNEILITAVGTLGNILRVKNEEPFYFKDGNLIWLKDIKEDPYFIEIVLENSKNKLLQSAIGSSQKALTIVALNKIKLKIPEMSEQQKIANFLTAIDDKISALDKKVTALKQYKKGVMQKIFSQQIRFRDENGDFYPDCEIKRLGEISNTFSGGTPTSSNKELYTGNIPFIKSGEISKNKTEQFISEIALSTSSAKIVDKGDILYALYGATSGQVAISKMKGAINQAVLCIKTTKNRDFIYQILLYKKENILNTYLQGGQGNLSADIIKKLKMSLPSMPEQQKIANFLATIDNKITTEESKLKIAKEWKKGLLQRMLV